MNSLPKNYITNASLQRILKASFKDWSNTIIETILDGMDRTLKDYATKKDLQSLEQKVDLGFSDVKRQLNDLKVDTPTQDEFNRLKGRVDKYLPT